MKSSWVFFNSTCKFQSAEKLFLPLQSCFFSFTLNSSKNRNFLSLFSFRLQQEKKLSILFKYHNSSLWEQYMLERFQLSQYTLSLRKLSSTAVYAGKISAKIDTLFCQENSLTEVYWEILADFQYSFYFKGSLSLFIWCSALFIGHGLEEVNLLSKPIKLLLSWCLSLSKFFKHWSISVRSVFLSYKQL